ncbi:MAG: hypothetical protein AVDCRST_MAG86-2170 [uncultured Truepera sp.]|uniref:Uncharacterized protein n=1 Tax=uncultured Truepera sp. TaxID=543023 RepID=A0A6J4VD68_9DEIN|nr:MAG: hypothetical protein AVDCRST_MAG86-2170 [uncultured Truepera sp.]
MARPDFRKLSTALDTAKRAARSQDTAGLTDLLELTAGTGRFDVEGVPTDVTVYRPFYAAARWLRQNPKHIVEARGLVGAKYADLEAVVNDLIEMQAPEDARLDLTIPFGYEAVVVTLPELDADTPVFAGVVR